LVARTADYDGFRGHFDLLPAVIDDGIAQILQDGARAYLTVLQAHHTTTLRGYRETALLPRRVSHGPDDHICRPQNLTARDHSDFVLDIREGHHRSVLINDLEDLLRLQRVLLVQQVHVDVLIPEVPGVEEAEGLITGQPD
jgi:hypothetical protein